ncbi:MAG: Jag N-terminal domain-containing protein [Treponema sp.]|jgi:predicted RNA-binding protein Jag|nr:Jag N-terminal domain-containing protein [Treponema sp.]
MVDFVRLQHIIKEQLDRDRAIRIVEARGPTLEMAVSEASTLLDVPVRRLEYEVSERGSAGFLGTGKKDWAIRAYERIYAKKDRDGGELSGDDAEYSAPVVEDKDGEAYIHLSADGAFLKVVPPKGKGKRAADSRAVQALQGRGVENVDEALVAKVVRDAAGTYLKVGDFQHRPVNDSIVSVEISDGR